MRIGELARRSGVSASAIRFYERRGLLDPPPRTPAGYRDYPVEALARLAFVRAGQDAGLTLAELRALVDLRAQGSPPCREVTRLLERKATAIRRQIGELERVERELQRLADRAARVDPRDCPPVTVCRIVAAGPGVRGGAAAARSGAAAPGGQGARAARSSSRSTNSSKRSTPSMATTGTRTV